MSGPTRIDLAEDLEAVLLGIVAESWRFAATFERAVSTLDGKDGQRYRSRLAYFRERVHQELAPAGFHIVDLNSGTSYEPGMAITPINLEEFEEGDQLVIDQVIDPTIMGPEGIKRMGTVTLRKVN